jgi:hypothetical protein
VSEIVAEKTESKPAEPTTRGRMARVNATKIRVGIAQLVWLVCVVFALILAAGAFLISLQGSATNSDNALYKFVVDAGSTLDFSVLSRENGLFDFVGKNSETKDALANWGLAAILWLVIGRIADRLIRP